MRNKRDRVIAPACLVVALAVAVGTLGCPSSKGERLVLEGGKRMDSTAALAAITRAEASGKLDGLEIEHYVAGGLPPPYYRSEQFRLFVDHGRDTLAFVVHDVTAKVKQGEQFPRHVYKLPASPSDVKTIARLVRESGAFKGAPPAEGERPHDSMRTELVAILGGKEAKRVYAGAEPAELAKLREVIDPLIARLKAHGVHQVVR